MAGRLNNVDGLRGLAALLVIFGHWGEFVADHARDARVAGAMRAVLLDYFSFGRAGIVAFFCISGFVIPFSFRGRQPKRAFLVSRVFRLYPAYWLSLLVGLVTVPLVTGSFFSAREIAANITMVPLFLRQSPVIGVYWTLHIELVFYAACFALFAVARLHDARVNASLICCYTAIGVAAGAWRFAHAGSGLPIGIPTYLAAMHVGTLARLHLIEHDARAARLFAPALVVLLAGVMVTNTAGYLHASDEAMGWIATNTGYLTGVALFLLCVRRGLFARQPLVYAGAISYSLYLFHIPAIQCWEALWPHLGDWRVAALLGTVFVFATAIGVSGLVYRLVERPAIRAARRIEAGLDAR